MRDARTAKAAVALTHQILARGETLILDQPIEYDARQIFHVRFGVIKTFLGLVLLHLGVAETCPYRIDEYEICKIQPGAWVVDRCGRIRGTITLGTELH